MTFGIMLVHHHPMGSYKQVVVLFPGIDELAIAIENHEVVLPARVALGIARRQRVTGRIAFRNDRVRRRDRRQTTTLEHVNAIGALRPDATCRTGLPAVSTDVLRPIDFNVVRSRDVVAALSLRHGGHGNRAKHQYCHSDHAHILLASRDLVLTLILRRLRSQCVGADAFFTPVASRFATYGVVLDGAAHAYRQTLLNSRGMVAWTESALAETEFVAMDEPYA